MVREIDYTSPLSEDDIAYLRQRKSEGFVQRMIELAGTAKSGKKGKKSSEADEKARKEAEEAEAREKAEAAEKARQEAEDEDIVGAPPTFDPLKATEAEVKAHIEGLEGDAQTTEKARIAEVEKAREDREPRKGVLALAES